MVDDKGKSRGHGYIHYFDNDLCVAAVKKLNNRVVKGRALKVQVPADQLGDIVGEAAEQSAAGILPAPVLNLPYPGSAFPPPGAAPLPMPYPGGYPPPQVMGGVGGYLPPPQQVVLPPPLMDAPIITKTLQTTSPHEFFDWMTQMKILVQRDPEHAREILSQNPQLSYSFMQILLMLNLVRYEEVQQILQRPQQSGVGMPPPVGPPPAGGMPQYGGYPGMGMAAPPAGMMMGSAPSYDQYRQ